MRESPTCEAVWGTSLMRLAGHSTRLGRKRCSEDASNFEWKSNPKSLGKDIVAKCQGKDGMDSFYIKHWWPTLTTGLCFFLFGGKGRIHWRVTYARGYARVTFMQRCQHEFLPQKGSLTSKKHNSCNRAQLLTIRIARGWGITCWRPIPQPHENKGQRRATWLATKNDWAVYPGGK